VRHQFQRLEQDVGGAVAKGMLRQLAFIEAARAAEMSAIVPIDYSRVIFAELIGYLVWSELPDAWAVASAALIGASTCFISFREMQLARTAHRGGADVPVREGLRHAHPLT
jgi:drug/metabolite transporter (DMT)-like permease